ncbi:unnamed protein product [Merluccius merluccius]
MTRRRRRWRRGAPHGGAHGGGGEITRFISSGDESAYRTEVDYLASWGSQYNLDLMGPQVTVVVVVVVVVVVKRENNMELLQHLVERPDEGFLQLSRDLNDDLTAEDGSRHKCSGLMGRMLAVMEAHSEQRMTAH